MYLLSRLRSGALSWSSVWRKTDVHPSAADEDGLRWVFFADALNFSFWTEDGEPKYEVTYKVKQSPRLAIHADKLFFAIGPFLGWEG